MTDSTHHRAMSSINDFTLLELDRPDHGNGDGTLKELSSTSMIPRSTLVIVTETEKLHEDPTHGRSGSSTSLVASLSDFDFAFSKLQVKDWDMQTFYSDYIQQGREYLKETNNNVIMLFESPSSSTADSSFHNKTKYKFHDWPPPVSTRSKGILGPCRYALMNGTSYPAFLRDGQAPDGLFAHWQKTVPGVVVPTLVPKVTDNDVVYAYLPVEQIQHHVNDPNTHYHLAGKDAIHLMTQKTTKLLPDTRTSRPCVVKTTHSMGSKGIFIIRNDDDEAEFEQFLNDSGHPTFVVTDFVDIARNVACHFFLHPDGEHLTWFGSNENKRLPDGSFSSDSYLEWQDQEKLKKMQLPFVEEVAQYCKSLGFWGFCGVDVLFDSRGRGYLVDINPRVTGSCPALMTLQLLRDKYAFTLGLFRRSGDINYYGDAQSLWKQVDEYNFANEGKIRIVIHSMYEAETGDRVRINIGVYGTDMEDCKAVLNQFAEPKREESP
ncbi:predicted protein [Phaeodactylum tricornutum CCAP 1055/1]|jgi:hypothetical protein|uniref:ATP-grasp domain-containing protein n=1 Tax=Phaeodactylum tricornutum (strain CCAP 1055/1) TaxID=556484 RepID=B7FQU5_PHATC|nr:predicted protein [Phaeodactylum tricornutum CCAP 1055/1]EEC51929.1 predicted protein [Phaeodactylum tricornutum CCAP 1055/1]|eukprot:XP_002177466.1 predicted protein [Phaeodactylum tricornutum CCAP 1055/1]